VASLFLPTVVPQIEAGVATMETLENVLRLGDTRHLPEQPHICRTFPRGPGRRDG
jgi:hypothetical protein